MRRIEKVGLEVMVNESKNAHMNEVKSEREKGGGGEKRR